MPGTGPRLTPGQGRDPHAGMIDIIAQYPGQTMAMFSLLLTGVAWLATRIAQRAPQWANAVLIQTGAIVRSIVDEVAQVYVDELKAARADGKLTEAEKAHARQMAWDRCLELLSWSQLKRVLGDTQKARDYVGAELEAAVNRRKAAATPRLDPTKRSRSNV